MTVVTDVGERVVDRARGMRDLVRSEAAESERLRTLTPAVVDEMWATGLMSSFNPVAAGGVEPSFPEMIETWIEMAWQDGSFGWIGIANLPSTFAAATYLSDEGFAEVFTKNDNYVAMGGQFFPNGQGAVVDGGYRVSGAWSFGSVTAARSRVVGARGRQEHARRCRGTRRDQGADERHGDVGQPPDLSEGSPREPLRQLAVAGLPRRWPVGRPRRAE